MRILIALFLIVSTQLSAASGKPSDKEWESIKSSMSSFCMNSEQGKLKLIIERAKKERYIEEVFKVKFLDTRLNCLQTAAAYSTPEVFQYLLEEGAKYVEKWVIFCAARIVNNKNNIDVLEKFYIKKSK